MGNQFNDNLYSNCFTPREYQVELLDAAKSRNIIICLQSASTKAFISIKLVQELAYDVRNLEKKTVHVTNEQNIDAMKLCLEYLTDLQILCLKEQETSSFDEIQNGQVIVTTATMFTYLVNQQFIELNQLNLLIIDECHSVVNNAAFIKILGTYKDLKSKPRVLGLTSSLFEAGGSMSTIEASLERLENYLHSSVETASDIVTLLRYSQRPVEMIIECDRPVKLPLNDLLKVHILKAQEFLDDHRYDLFELYQDTQLLEDLKKIPDPKIEPQQIYNDLLYCLNNYGPWGCDRAAAVLYGQIEKSKTRTPYDRHYLLLCMASTLLAIIRCVYEDEVKQLTDAEKLKQFSSPKILRLIEIFHRLKPEEQPFSNVATQTDHEDAFPFQLEIDEFKCDTIIENKKGNFCDKSTLITCKYLSPVEKNIVQVRNGRTTYRNVRGSRRPMHLLNSNPDALCGIIFVEEQITTRVLFSLFCELSRQDPKLKYISVQYILESNDESNKNKVQEEVLKKFRMHDCNLLISNTVLEETIEIPRCNVVVHFDEPKSYRDYVQCKSRARTHVAYHLFTITEDQLLDFTYKLAEYYEINNILLKKCANAEPSLGEQIVADQFNNKVEVYKPDPNGPSLHLKSAIILLNRYCARLPSDTFTRLTPIWAVNKLEIDNQVKYQCTVRLPINSPLKRSIVGPAMSSFVLARRITALRTCKILHSIGELDKNLMPIGKEGFRAFEPDWDSFPLEEDDEQLSKESTELRPGTTKRRQYYTKRFAQALTNCLPTVNTPCYLYYIDMNLTCPLPEEQNTRGRKIYPPENSPQGFGILTSKPIPKICSFPIFTRSGEVNVSLNLSKKLVKLNKNQWNKIYDFINYMFTNVLRLQKYLMVYSPTHSEHSYFIVPALKSNNQITIDWKFLDVIHCQKDLKPQLIPEETRKDFQFDSNYYEDAVVMPWYRNQDQPQFFYVAEICNHLEPDSSFPGADYETFEEYYNEKYGIMIQNRTQPLLDVDHTSARLNFLTPRYVNRKGVALPTSSEETKRAKRENLEHKQILVPELCTVHAFPASLWRKAVCLPCILYRINALLLADEIRKQLAVDLNLGSIKLRENFEWAQLDFGWSLAAVLKRSNENKSEAVAVETEDMKEAVEVKKKKRDGELEIGTWSNDMAENFTPNRLYRTYSDEIYHSDSDSDSVFSIDLQSNPDDYQSGQLRIEFKNENLAEAYDDGELSDVEDSSAGPVSTVVHSWNTTQNEEYLLKYKAAVTKNQQTILTSGIIVHKTDPLIISKITNHKHIFDEINSDLDDTIKIDLLEPESEQPTTEISTNNNNTENDLKLKFKFDYQPELKGHPGPSPSVILQALTMSNANDGINLERLETIGDSFLKYAITNYLYCNYENVHEGKLSHLRSKQVSNLNLYRLGRRKKFGENMIATKFEPHDNWLPPCFYVPRELTEATPQFRKCEGEEEQIPYNLLTQQSIPDKSIADCVEALIGAYLIECGPRGALLFMAWLGIRVLPLEDYHIKNIEDRPVGSLKPTKQPDSSYRATCYGLLNTPKSPLLKHLDNPYHELNRLLDGYDKFEKLINYRFNDRSYLLQSLTHASYYPNQLTDCYQRLEFLGDAVLDYLITRHLYEDERQHSPGALTDLRSALVNNTIFASLAVRFGFHKYFRHLSPGLHDIIDRFVRIQESNNHLICEEYYLSKEDECEEAEDVEVPKALGDVFESVAGAIFLDSGMSLDAVWQVYYTMMHQEIEMFSTNVPKSPIRELLELEPETAKFGKPEKLADGRRVRVSVEVFGKGVFKGIGRNYRIAKCTAAKCALKQLRKKKM